MSETDKTTPELVIKYRGIKRTLTHQVEWEKIQDLRSGALFMTLPNSNHFNYVKKFIQPLLLEPFPGIIGIVSLSCLMTRGDHKYRTVTHWTIIKVSLSLRKEDWIITLGGEVK